MKHFFKLKPASNLCSISTPLAQVVYFVFFLIPLGVLSQNQFQEAFENEKRPFRKDLKIEFTDSQNNQTFLPITVIKGKKDGPVFTMAAGVHGFEYPPIMATQQLMAEINFEYLTGTLLIIPIASTGSFYEREPFKNPQDNVNLNNAFPGKSDGTVTQKIAHFVTENVIPMSDVFLDIHCGDAPEDLLPFICYYDNKKYPDQTDKAQELSENSGFEYVVSYPFTLKDDDPAKYMLKQACQDGKTALSIESGRLGIVEEAAVTLTKNAVYRMLSKMGMYNKTIEEPLPKLVRLNNQKYIDADAQGIFYSNHKAGNQVQKGEKVGYITDEFGNTISEFEAPVSGTILYKIATPPVNVDDTIMCISFSE